jgi:quinol monooxygenase YgiN
MITFTLRLVAPPKKRNEIVDALASFVGPTQVEPGCLSCHLVQDVKDHNVMAFLEEWETQEDLDRHMSSDEYRKLLTLMDMSAQPPEVVIDTVASRAGLERIRLVRKSAPEPRLDAPPDAGHY